MQAIAKFNPLCVNVLAVLKINTTSENSYLLFFNVPLELEKTIIIKRYQHDPELEISAIEHQRKLFQKEIELH